jgi:hypothetical protein
MKSLRLADTSVKAYKKRNGNISLHLKSYLMAIAKGGAGYSLTSYLKNIECYITLEDNTQIKFEEISISVNSDYAFDTMVHSFKAVAITNLNKIKGAVGKLRVIYHISFTGHPSEEPEEFQLAVPIVKRY